MTSYKVFGVRVVDGSQRPFEAPVTAESADEAQSRFLNSLQDEARGQFEVQGVQ